MAKILITGGSGLLGKVITRKLIEQGHAINWLTRSPTKISHVNTFKWNVDANYIDKKAFEGVSKIIHLAGEGIADKRWTTKRKQTIIDSRVKSSALLYNVLKGTEASIDTFIGASAIGYYGAVTTETIFKETDLPCNDFLGTSCQQWEASYAPFLNDTKIRTCVFRIGNVLSANGGALPKIAQPFKYYLGAPIGTGKQYMPWIHEEDIAAIFTEALVNQKISGVYNAVATQSVTNKEFSQTLATVLNKPMWLPNVPSFVLKLALGELANVVLEGSRVSNEKLLQTGYIFKYDTLNKALHHLFQKK